jgi:hypothetical protein
MRRSAEVAVGLLWSLATAALVIRVEGTWISVAIILASAWGLAFLVLMWRATNLLGAAATLLFPLVLQTGGWLLLAQWNRLAGLLVLLVSAGSLPVLAACLLRKCSSRGPKVSEWDATAAPSCDQEEQEWPEAMPSHASPGPVAMGEPLGSVNPRISIPPDEY